MERRLIYLRFQGGPDYLNSVILKLVCHQNDMEGLLKKQIGEPTPVVPDSVGLGWS